MAARVTSCPNCGGQVEFKAGASLLAVCGYCSSAVARVGDDISELEILGKVAPLADIGSPLSVGTTGKQGKKAFTIVGRVQLDYGMGPWNEWYAQFDDGRWGWIAEAQGKVYLTFPVSAGDQPPFPHWRVGTRFRFEGQPLVVTERRRATFVSAEGELPFTVKPGANVFYCDVEGPGGVFGTLDFGSGRDLETIFLGKQVEYGDLFSKDILRDVQASQAAAAVAMNCPNCGSGIELRAPNESLRVTCDACDSLLDCGEGELQLMKGAKRKGPDPLIPLGSSCKYLNKTWTVYGHMIRSVVVDFVKYAWEEYLLRASPEDGGGYRWLVANDGHWIWMTPVSAGDVSGGGLARTYRDQSYRHFQSSAAKVETLRGEFYWKVGLNDVAAMADYVAPPYILSCERTEEETNWSRGEYLEPDTVKALFKLPRVPFRTGISPCQPNPHKETRRGTLLLASVFSVLLLCLAMVLGARADNFELYRGTHPIPVGVNPANTAKMAETVVLTEPFALEGPNSLSVRVSAQVNNSWIYVQGALINVDTGEVRQFGVEVSYYRGYSGGESWSEGSLNSTVYLGSVKSGNYVLRFQPQGNLTGIGVPPKYNVSVRSDLFFSDHLVFWLFVLWVYPLAMVVRSMTFEGRRWAESDHATG